MGDMGGKIQIVLAAHFLNSLNETSLSKFLAKIEVPRPGGASLPDLRTR